MKDREILTFYLFYRVGKKGGHKDLSNDQKLGRGGAESKVQRGYC